MSRVLSVGQEEKEGNEVFVWKIGGGGGAITLAPISVIWQFD